MITQKAENVGLIVIASVPLAWVAGLLAYTLRARVHLGYWPAPYYPDPKGLPFDLHYTLVFIGIYFVLPALAVLVGVRLFFSIHLRASRTWRKALVVCSLGWGLLIIMALVPPINFVAWFLD